MKITNINSGLRGVARIWRAGIGYRDFRTVDLHEAKAEEILALIEHEQARSRLLTYETGFSDRPDLARTRTADGGYVYYRARHVSQRLGIHESDSLATEVVALWTSILEWRDDVADRLDSLGLPPKDPATSNWVSLGDITNKNDKLFARLWIKGKGCKYYCRGVLSEPEADEITRLIVAQQSGPRIRVDSDRPASLRLSDPNARLFALTVESPDPDNPGRRVPEVLALLTSDRNTWSREVGASLKELMASLPRDEDGLRDEGWAPVRTTSRLVRVGKTRRFSLRSLLRWN